MDTLGLTFSKWALHRRTGKTYAKLWLAVLGRTIPFGDPITSPHETLQRNGIDIDRVIVPMVEALWSAGIETFNSCQGDPDLDESAHHASANFYGECYAATVTVDSYEDAHRVMRALEASMGACGFENQNYRVTATFGVSRGIFVNFPARLLVAPGFLMSFQNDLLVS